MIRERFAPSPTGQLHLGHAFSALTAWDHASAVGGEMLIRIEDIDHTRCRAEFEAANLDDLAWLGLRWPQPVWRQSNRLSDYDHALTTLITNDLCFPCSCTRSDIKTALSAPQDPGTKTRAIGPDGPVYPGTCRHRLMTSATKTDSIRLNMTKAIAFLGGAKALTGLTFTEIGGAMPVVRRLGRDGLQTTCGDIVLARRDIKTSYHLAVVVDDAAQGITHITRGQDIFTATPIHRLLQALLNLPTPFYRHHRLIRDAGGQRLAKRCDARAIGKYRAEGATVTDIRALVGL